MEEEIYKRWTTIILLTRYNSFNLSRDGIEMLSLRVTDSCNISGLLDYRGVLVFSSRRKAR